MGRIQLYGSSKLYFKGGAFIYVFHLIYINGILRNAFCMYFVVVIFLLKIPFHFLLFFCRIGEHIIYSAKKIHFMCFNELNIELFNRETKKLNACVKYLNCTA